MNSEGQSAEAGGSDWIVRIREVWDERRDAAQFDGIMLGGWTGRGDQIVAHNVGLGSVLKFANDSARQVVLGASDPEDAPHRQIGQMSEVHIGLVKGEDFTRLNIGAKLSSPERVMPGGGVHDGAAGQEGLEIETEMAFGGGFAARCLAQFRERASN